MRNLWNIKSQLLLECLDASKKQKTQYKGRENEIPVYFCVGLSWTWLLVACGGCWRPVDKEGGI